MERTDFYPLNKTYYFNFNEHSCHKCATGKCPLDDLSIEEILAFEKPYKYYIEERAWEYCTNLAKNMLGYDYSSEIWMNYNQECGHYSFSDGQHRTCIIARLYQKGNKVKFQPQLSYNHCKCPQCDSIDYFSEKEKSLKLLDKIFRTEKYIEVRNFNNRKFKDCLYKFDDILTNATKPTKGSQ